MYRNLIYLILISQHGKLASSVVKSIGGVALSIALLLFMMTKLDGFIVNIEDFMINLIPETQFQRLNKDAVPTNLNWDDASKFEKILSDEDDFIAHGPLALQYGIYQFIPQESNNQIIKQTLLVSNPSVVVKDRTEYLLNIEPYIQSELTIAEILKADDGVIISSRLARSLFGSTEPIGQTMQFGTRTAEKETLVSLTVRGVYQNNSVFVAFVPMPIYQKTTNQRFANNYIIRFSDKYMVHDWKESFSQKLLDNKDRLCALQETSEECITAKADAKFYHNFVQSTWMEFSPKNLRYLKMTRVIMMSIFVMVLLMTSVSIKLLFDTIVIEKRRQIALMKVMGYTNATVLICFIISGALIGFGGVGLGLVIGWTINWITSGMESYYFETIFNYHYRMIQPSTELLIWVSGITTTICMLSALLPALKILKIEPIEGLRRDD